MCMQLMVGVLQELMQYTMMVRHTFPVSAGILSLREPQRFLLTGSCIQADLTVEYGQDIATAVEEVGGSEV